MGTKKLKEEVLEKVEGLVCSDTDLVTELKRKITQYEGLQKFSRLIFSSMDIQSIKKQAAGKIKKLLECERVHIFKFDKSLGELSYLEINESDQSDLKTVTITIDESTFVGSCAHYRAVLHIKEIKKDPRYKNLSKRIKTHNPRNILLAPLMKNGELFGVVECINSLKKSFDDADVKFIEDIASKLALAFENAFLFQELREQFVQVCEALADAISKKDSYTGGHTKRVSFFSEMIAAELELDSRTMMELKLAATLHDIGKIGIEDKILKKPAPLTPDEFEVMKNHPRFGYEILKHVESLKNVTDGMKFHHERPDGLGYPYGLKGKEIPVIAMIISVADTFDAMISNRPYRKGLSPMIAHQEIIKHKGTQFSIEVVEAFDRAFRKTTMYRFEKKKIDKKAS
jgi:HD-GYP domain-containing protein (c-di-GMP phosphodiesterase class II)